MKLMMKKGIIAFGITLSLFSATYASPKKNLTPSQAVGAKYSPAALYKVSVSGNAKTYTASKARELVSNYLQAEGGFTFVDQERVNEIYVKVKEKAEKKAKRKNVTDTLLGKKSILDAILADSEDDAVYYASDVYSAVAKELKCKYFLKVSINAGVALFRKTDEFENPVKPMAETIIYIYDKKSELKKEIHAIYALPLMDMTKVKDKEEIQKLFPDLIEKSIALAAENLDKKEKLFEINILKPETIELVTNSDVPNSISSIE